MLSPTEVWDIAANQEKKLQQMSEDVLQGSTWVVNKLLQFSAAEPPPD